MSVPTQVSSSVLAARTFRSGHSVGIHLRAVSDSLRMMSRPNRRNPIPVRENSTARETPQAQIAFDRLGSVAPNSELISRRGLANGWQKSAFTQSEWKLPGSPTSCRAATSRNTPTSRSGRPSILKRATRNAASATKSPTPRAWATVNATDGGGKLPGGSGRGKSRKKKRTNAKRRSGDSAPRARKSEKT